MSYDCIRIERERDGYAVTVTDPEIVAANQKRDMKSGGDSEDAAPSDPWRDPNVEYEFQTKEQVLAFVEKAIDIALPADDYSSTFDKLAKEAKGTTK